MAKEKGRFRRNKKSVHNCPICGVFVCEGYQTTSPKGDSTHECDPEFIRRSAATRDAIMKEEFAPRRMSESERIAEGFAMLEMDSDDYGDDD